MINIIVNKAQRPHCFSFTQVHKMPLNRKQGLSLKASFSFADPKTLKQAKQARD
jgi:hypothetical protein